MCGRNISIIHGAILKHLEKEACLSSQPMLSQRCTPAAAGSQVHSGQVFDLLFSLEMGLICERCCGKKVSPKCSEKQRAEEQFY